METLTINYDANNVDAMNFINIIKTGEKIGVLTIQEEPENDLTPYEKECIERGRKDYAEGKYTTIKDINNIWGSI